MMFLRSYRKPAVSGLFYPDSSSDLSYLISSYFDQSNPSDLDGVVRGLVLPHAGYRFSGQVAASGVQVVKDWGYDLVVIIGPSHYESFDGASVYGGKGYETPLGCLEIDSSVRSQLFRYDSRFSTFKRAHMKEHSIEVELPFLQYAGFDGRILPIVMGAQTKDMVQVLSDALLSICDLSKTLFIVSTDLSHFFPYDVAKKMDFHGLSLVESGADNEVLFRESDSESFAMCGFGPMMVVKRIMELGYECQPNVLSYMNSGDVGGDLSRVVGYGSLAYFDLK